MLFGPLTLVLDSSRENQFWGAVLLVLCATAFASAIVRPRPWSLVLAALAAVLWLIAGWLGVGINC
ncbi:hypothetical protein GobsT_11450 [Gemmata obscuriglobus]|uniref:Uncharacterized protein n=1 Tax=Gemmata obscuriglobus TaxID=114 RepID=A0A2Z3HG38_9BACT|nr:hypothetical protein [Gemmata obscuriglobus]AWM40370.1 hypothetical protein C1280_27490 [Gemmata obscuriglobus]QEG26406.1 hypothetical protein GobsT_11450 [Gemmata obscuriglobus]VTS01507.1 unnamed protein product [Gemmata obscuriglobus UQM 2246]